MARKTVITEMGNPMAKALVPTHKSTSVLYRRMQTAIAECNNIDDCKHIAAQAGGIAAYYEQIKDDESVRKFIQIKLRAWRRIGEILLTAGIDKSKCESVAEYIRKIRAAFNRADVDALNDASFRQALKVGELPPAYFDKHVMRCRSIDHLLVEFQRVQRREWEATPQGRAQLREQEKRAKEEIEIETARRTKQEQEWAEEQRQTEQKEAEFAQFKEAREEAFKEVGITLDRRDREKMHQIVFLLKKHIYEALRQAAFDNHMTMQAVLRAGLMMWFIAHGYSVPPEDMKLPSRKSEQMRKNYEK
jgi:hypothetical protein